MPSNTTYNLDLRRGAFSIPFTLYRDDHTAAPETRGVPAAAMTPEHEWDAGDMGCGDLVLELRARMARLGPGQVLRLVARDPGAPADLPAWCRMTGHTLVSGQHPVYLIRRKET